MTRREQSSLAKTIERDILRDDPRSDAAKCFQCARGVVGGGSRFCSERCRGYFDAGFPAQDANSARAALKVPLDDWKIMAGPPDAVIGGSYYAPILERVRRVKRRRKVNSGVSPTNSIFVRNSPTMPAASKGTFEHIGAAI
jgi:hypothetical protein